MGNKDSTTGLVSCFPDRLYCDGGFYDDSLISLDDLRSGGATHAAMEWIKVIYPSYKRWRRDPERIIGLDGTMLEAMPGRHLSINQRFSSGAACALIHIPHAYLLDRVLYVPGSDGLDIVYETYRPNDRPAVKASEYSYAVMRPDNVISVDGDQQVYLGSSGCFNYGHWLVDDLTRVQSTKELSATYILPSFGENINAIRQEALSYITSSPIVFVDNYLPAKLSNLLFVSPTSYHPVIKSPAALEFVRSAFIHLFPASVQYKSILVLRRNNTTRSLMNQESIISLAQEHGFKVVYPEELTFREQVIIFSGADRVLGVMGAGMTNTIFCKSGTELIYMAPLGWLEPFYWDLADALQQSYSIIFGKVENPEIPPHFSSFLIELDHLQEMLTRK